MQSLWDTPFLALKLFNYNATGLFIRITKVCRLLKITLIEQRRRIDMYSYIKTMLMTEKHEFFMLIQKALAWNFKNAPYMRFFEMILHIGKMYAYNRIFCFICAPHQY